jgi:YD repeat-containing protein
MAFHASNPAIAATYCSIGDGGNRETRFANEITEASTVDDSDELTSVRESSGAYSASYTYDANGNRTNRTVNGVSETYTVDDADKLTSVMWSGRRDNFAKEYAYH